MTRQRQVILEELRQTNSHPSADELYEMVRKRLPRISLGTVYRNLEILSESGEIQKVEFGSSLKRFDGFAHLHYHIRCVRCDRLVDAPSRIDLDIEESIQDQTEFQILGHKLVFTGLCPDCQ
jgi:Fur family ferric uptake transcriptional regulator